MVIYSDVNVEVEDACLGVEGRRIIVFFRMMLLALLMSRNMIFGENLSFARVASGEIEGCVVCTGVGRCS
jgi:hypothetical protein